MGADFLDLYELKEKLGEGAHALVHKAIRKCDGEEFAVKVFRSSDPEIIASIRKTYQIGSMLSHPNLIKVKELYINQ
jgi:calcium-dependent protein kinase